MTIAITIFATMFFSGWGLMFLYDPQDADQAVFTQIAIGFVGGVVCILLLIGKTLL